jgi:hypothetical protein
VDLDRDRDGFPAPLDCDDGRRDIHPGAVEVLGNRVDEDCDRVADPFAAFATVALLSPVSAASPTSSGLSSSTSTAASGSGSLARARAAASSPAGGRPAAGPTR